MRFINPKLNKLIGYLTQSNEYLKHCFYKHYLYSQLLADMGNLCSKDSSSNDDRYKPNRKATYATDDPPRTLGSGSKTVNATGSTNTDPQDAKKRAAEAAEVSSKFFFTDLYTTQFLLCVLYPQQF